MSLRGKAAVVGVAESELGEVGPGYTPLDLIGQAALRALEDAGLDKSVVDGLFSASAYYHMPTLSVAVAAREWAKLNPKAFMREDLTVEDVLASRMVSSPLSVRDCCLVTDGGGAAIVTSLRERTIDDT